MTNCDIEILKKVNSIFNSKLRNKTSIQTNTKHVYERLVERDLHIIDYQKAMINLINKHLCLFLFYTHLPENIRPYKINVVSSDIIVVLTRRDSTWKVNTVLNPKFHNKHDDVPSKQTGFEINIVV